MKNLHLRRGYGGRAKFKILSLLLAAGYLLLVPSSLLAESKPPAIKFTPSKTESQVHRATISPTLKTREGKTIKEALEFEKEKPEATRPGELKNWTETREIKSRAYSGVIKSIAGQSIFLAGKDGARQINATDQTKIYRSEKKEVLKFSDLKVGDQIVAMGSLGGNVMSAQIIMVTPAKKPELKRHSVNGIVQSISGQILTLRHLKQNKIYSVTITSETEIKIKGKNPASFSDIKIGDRITATGVIENEILVAKHLFVIPGRGLGLENTSTGSAYPTRLPKLSSPSGSPKPR